MDADFESVVLRTPPLPCLVPEGMFDDFAWCKSRTLEFRKPFGPLAAGEPIDGANPSRMAFVFRSEVSFLPRELATLHVSRLAREGEWALAPYAIDDATDELCARRVPPESVMLLAADRTTALIWGLHDWAHFHNHGAFEPHQRAFTELQCDASALVWLAINEPVLQIGDDEWKRVHRELEALSNRRFAESAPRIEFDASWLAEGRLDAIASACNWSA